MPPASERAFPSEETARSMRVPGRAKAGRRAVTITAATFLAWTCFGSTRMPSRPSMPAIDCEVKATLSESPVPARPTTRPYP